jgi:hypothetical protein
MFRRWLIRTFFLLPILLCVAGWLWSGFYASWLSYSQDGKYVECIPLSGVLVLEWGWDSRPRDRWQSEAFQQARTQLWQSRFWLQPRQGAGIPAYVLGFSFDHRAHWYCVAIPFWFLILAFSALFFLIYRKTRPKPSPDTAFPVEPDEVSNHRKHRAPSADDPARR